MPSRLSHATRRWKDPSGAAEFVGWTMERFAQQNLVLSTGFGMEGCVLIDLYAGLGKPLQVSYLDTGFFFPETHELIGRLRRRYPHLDFRDRGTSLTPEQQALRHGDRLWERDPDLCCRLRKVEPMRQLLAGADVWVTALRRRQSSQRAGIELVEWNWKYEVVRVCPLAYWTRGDVQAYVSARGVPYNRLHDQGYPSIGCTHCTRPVAGLPSGGYTREGRWSGRAKTECGLHL